MVQERDWLDRAVFWLAELGGPSFTHGDSGEAYVSKRNAERGVFRLLYWSSLVLRVQR